MLEEYVLGLPPWDLGALLTVNQLVFPVGLSGFDIAFEVYMGSGVGCRSQRGAAAG